MQRHGVRHSETGTESTKWYGGKAKDNLCLHYNIPSCPPLRRKMKGKACLTVAFVHFITKSKASSSQGWSGPPSVVGVRILFSDLQIQ